MTPSERASYILNRYRDSILSPGGKEDLHALLAYHFEVLTKAQSTPVPCPDHPQYQGKRKPRKLCETCWQFYLAKK